MAHSDPVALPEAEEPPAQSGSPPSALRRAWKAVRDRWARHLAIAALVIGGVAATGHFIGGMIGWWHLYEVFHKPAKPARHAPVPAHALSLVVMPLIDEGGADGNLADIITSDVTTSLGQLTGMLVISRDTAFTYKGKTVDPREVSRELGVRYVVRGSMRREGDRVQINLAMIDGNTGLQDWSQQFAFKRTELDAGLQTVTAQVGRSLGVEMMKASARRSVALQPDQVDADDIAIRGWGVYFQGWSKENATEALRLFEEAVRRDPKSVRGWGGVGIMHTLMVFNGWAADRPASLKRMDEALQKLQALDQDDPMTHVMRMQVANMRNDFGALLQAAEGTLQRYPGHPRAHSLKTTALTWLGRTDECLEPGRQALRIDPRNVVGGWTHLNIALCHFMRGEYAEAAESARAAPLATSSLTSPYALRAAALAQLGQQAEARAALDEYRRKRPQGTSADVARVMRGNHEKTVASREVLVAALQALGLP